MKKFFIEKGTDEWQARRLASYAPGDAIADGETQIVRTFETKAEALEALKEYRNSYILRPTPTGSVVLATEYAVTESEDGFWRDDVLEIADSTEFDIVLHHDWLEENKFSIECATFDGSGFGEWMPVRGESEEWYESVKDFVKIAFPEYFGTEDDGLYYRIVATYGCRDADEDIALTWSELAELAED